MTTDPFTDAAEDRVDELWPYAPAGFPLPPARRMDRRIGFRLGAQWARAHLAAPEPTDAARIIDQHRENERWVGDGVKIECACGHTSHATFDFSGPITEDKNNHRDAERMHAAHVAQVLTAQEPTDAECLAVLNVAIVPLGEPPKRNGLADWNPAAVERVRAALSAARRDEEKQ